MLEVNNLVSIKQLPKQAQQKIDKELQAGRVAGPFGTKPVGLTCFPMGLVEKQVQGTYRLIHHLSYPHGKSVNSGIPKNYTSVGYSTVDDAISILNDLGSGAYLSKTDTCIKHAYKIIPINLQDQPLLGFSLHGKFYYDKTLPMGLSSSCRIFETFSTALHWVATEKLGITHMVHLLDDFLIISNRACVCLSHLNGFVNFC